MSGKKERLGAVVAEGLLVFGGLQAFIRSNGYEAGSSSRQNHIQAGQEVKRAKNERVKRPRRQEVRLDRQLPNLAAFGRRQETGPVGSDVAVSHHLSGVLQPGDVVYINVQAGMVQPEVIQVKGYRESPDRAEQRILMEQARNGQMAMAVTDKFLKALGANDAVVDSFLAMTPQDLAAGQVYEGMARGAVESAVETLGKSAAQIVRQAHLTEYEIKKLIKLDPQVLQKLGIWDAVRGPDGLSKSDLQKTKEFIHEEVVTTLKKGTGITPESFPYIPVSLAAGELAAVVLMVYGWAKKDYKIADLGMVLALGINTTACGLATPSGTVNTTEAPTQQTITASPTEVSVIVNATPGVPMSTETAIANPPPSPPPEIGLPTGWLPPTLEDMSRVSMAAIQYDGTAQNWMVGGRDVQDIQGAIKSIDRQLAESGSAFRFKNYYDAVMKIPGAVSSEMVISREGRWVIIARDANGQILWQKTANGLVPEYPYDLSLTKDNIAVIGADRNNNFEALPAEISEVVWAKEKVIAVGDKVNINGVDYFRRYYDPKDHQVKINNQPDVVKALLGIDQKIDVAALPQGSIVLADGIWKANIDGRNYVFGADGRWAEKPMWMENLPAGYTAIKNQDGSWEYAAVTGGQVSPIPDLKVDAAGAHFALDGVVVDIPANVIPDRIKVGQEGALQIYNEAGNVVDFAWDQKNNEWVNADAVIQPDKGTKETYQETFIHVKTWADLEELFRREKLFIPVNLFPENTYEWSTKDVVWDYLNVNNRMSDPLGKIPDGMVSPFQIMNHWILDAGEGRKYLSVGVTQAVHNFDDSVSLLHFSEDDFIPGRAYEGEISDFDSGMTFGLPRYDYEFNEIRVPGAVQNEIKFLNDKGLLDINGLSLVIKKMVKEWLTTGQVPPELEELMQLGTPRMFQ